MARVKLFDALPNYFGGKRRFAGRILYHLRKHGHRGPYREPKITTLIDGFLGGGSVCLLAKAWGHRVLCNDIAPRSHIIGKALIENSETKITYEDLLLLFKEVEHDGFIQTNYADGFQPRHAKFLDLALVNAREVQNEIKRNLLFLLLINFIMRLQPFGFLGARTLPKVMKEGLNEEQSKGRGGIKTIKRQGRYMTAPTLKALQIERRKINYAVRMNGYENQAYCEDIFTFLPKVEGDAIYLDPPYAGTISYEKSFESLDNILAGKVLERKRSGFSSKKYQGFLERLFETATKIPLWLISYGSAEISLDELQSLVEKYAYIEMVDSWRYRHLNALSTEESREKRKYSREHLIVATTGGK